MGKIAEIIEKNKRCEYLDYDNKLWIYDSEKSEEEIIELIKNEELMDKIGKKCNDKCHDDRWCPACESRLNGIYDFVESLIQNLRGDKL